MFAPTRDEARRFLIDAWRKHRAGEPLSALEESAARLVAMHPEYHAVIEAPELHVDRDYRPEQGDVNPFLHLSLHLAVAEQLAIDQPRGIVAHFERLRAARGDTHAGQEAASAAFFVAAARARRHSSGDASYAHAAGARRRVGGG